MVSKWEFRVNFKTFRDSLAQSGKKKATKWNNISNIELNFRVCFVDIADSTARAPKRAKQLSMATILSFFGVVLVSCRVNFHVVRSASQYSACRIYMSTHIGHQCFDQLTAVKTGYLLASITWPYRGLRSRPIGVKYFFWSFPLTSY